MWDLLLRGGRVINSASGFDRTADVASRLLPPGTAGAPLPCGPLSPAQQRAENRREQRVRASVQHLTSPEGFDEPLPRHGARP